MSRNWHLGGDWKREWGKKLINVPCTHVVRCCSNPDKMKESNMASMPIEVIDLRRNKTDDILRAVRTANSLQNEYILNILDESFSAEMELDVKSDTNIMNLCNSIDRAKEKWRGYHPYIVCIMDTPINDGKIGNLFSYFYEATMAITTHNVSEFIIPSEKIVAYLIFELAIYIVGISVDGLPWHHLGNECVFDYRQNKMLIKDAIKNIYICDDCRSNLQGLGKMSPAQMSALLKMLSSSSRLYTERDVSKMTKDKIFVGSSVEGLKIAQAIQADLDHEFIVEIWNQSGVFGLGSATLEALESAVNSYSYGIFVFTPDDLVKTRRKLANVPRDNVIFEAGLFIGKLGRRKTFLVRPRVDIQMPSDLHGIIVADYDANNPNTNAALGTACSKIRNAIVQAKNFPGKL